jgi:hypothetical protein
MSGRLPASDRAPDVLHNAKMMMLNEGGAPLFWVPFILLGGMNIQLRAGPCGVALPALTFPLGFAHFSEGARENLPLSEDKKTAIPV